MGRKLLILGHISWAIPESELPRCMVREEMALWCGPWAASPTPLVASQTQLSSLPFTFSAGTGLDSMTLSDHASPWSPSSSTLALSSESCRWICRPCPSFTDRHGRVTWCSADGRHLPVGSVPFLLMKTLPICLLSVLTSKGLCSIFYYHL